MSSKGRVLVVEDDPDIMKIIQSFLEGDGYEILAATDGHTALELIRQDVDLLVLDVGLPGLDGLEVTRRVREFSPIPILIVSARGEGADRVLGLEFGADDYLVKPFLPREMVARVKALLRRSKLTPATAPVQDTKTGVYVDNENRRAFLDGESLSLTAQEYEMLKVLAGAPGKNFTREELLDRVWGDDYMGQSRRVDLCVGRLRAKLERPGKPGPIRSIWGVGYRFEP